MDVSEKALDSYRLSHYRNVYRLLKLWGCREELCLAGLLHGTVDKVSQSRRVQSADVPHDASMADMDEVSCLLATYGMLYRGRDLLSASLTGTWTENQIRRFELGNIDIEKACIRDQLTLEVANQVDKYLDTPFIVDYLAAINKVTTIIPTKAAEYLYNAVTSTRKKQAGAVTGIRVIRPCTARVANYYSYADLGRLGRVATAVHGILRFSGHYLTLPEYMPLPKWPPDEVKGMSTQDKPDADVHSMICNSDHANESAAATLTGDASSISLSSTSNLPAIGEQVVIFRQGGKSALKYYMPFLPGRQSSTRAGQDEEQVVTLKSDAYDAPLANMVFFLAALAKFNHDKLHDLSAFLPVAENVREAYDYASRMGMAIQLLSGRLAEDKLMAAHAAILGHPTGGYRSLFVKVGNEPGLDGRGNACPPPGTMPQYMEDFMALFNETGPDTKSLSRMYLQFLLVHPFLDGNGRMARCLAVSKLASFTKTSSVGAIVLLATTLDKRRLDEHVGTLNSSSYTRSIHRWNRYVKLAADINAHCGKQFCDEWRELYPGRLMHSLTLGSLRPIISCGEFQDFSREYDDLDSVYVKVAGRDDLMICRHFVDVAVRVRRVFERGGIA